MNNLKKTPPTGKPSSDTRHMRIPDMPEEERPYEKCERYGPSALSDAELLAVVIRSGSAQFRATELACRILKLNSAYHGLNCLYHVSMKELMSICGIGRVKAVQLVCAAELARRMNREESVQKPVFDSPEAAIGFYRNIMSHLEHEEVHAAYLDVKLRLITSECVFKGTLSRSLFEPREIFAGALRYNAAFIILAHNHPSGIAEVSESDTASTLRIDKCGKILGIMLYDHIIIGRENSISMKEEGYI